MEIGTADMGNVLPLPQRVPQVQPGPPAPSHVHQFDLYRSGWSGEEVPWSDNQLWARGAFTLEPMVENQLMLSPTYGSVATVFMLRLRPAIWQITEAMDAAEAGWVCWMAELSINYSIMNRVPLAWYVGAPSDWPSGLARFYEPYGMQVPGRTYRDNTPPPRGVWTVAVRRTS